MTERGTLALPAEVAPFALLRVAALPYALLPALAPPATTARIAAARDAWRQMEELRSPLEAALYAAVPRAAPRLRRLLLALGRDVHNRRLRRPADDARAMLAAGLDGEAARLTAAWLDASGRARAALDTAADGYADELRTHTRAGLRALAAREDFLRPLALASPPLFDHLAAVGDGAHEARPRSSKLERALLAYAMRAGAKTSPFSTFMHHALLPLDPAAPDRPLRLHGEARTSVGTVDRGALAALEAAVQQAGALPGGTYRINPGLVWRDGVAELPVQRYTAVARRLWRREERARFRFHPDLADRLRRLPDSFDGAQLVDSVRAAAPALDPAAVGDWCARLIAAQLVQPLPWADAFEPAPARRLAARLDSTRGEGARAAGSLAGALAAAAAELATADARRRRALDAQAYARWDEAWRALPAAARPPSIALLHEDGCFARPLEPLGGAVPALLRELPAALQPSVHEKPAYAWMRQRFVATYGAGGVCRDVPAFLQTLRAAPRVPDDDPAARPRPAGGRRLPVSIFVQLADARADGGELLAVVNQVHSGGGALFARSALGPLPFHAGLAEALRAWIQRATAPAEPIDIPVCGECNSLQAHPRLTGRVLGWGDEPVVGDAVLPLTACQLRHDPARDLLVLADGDGCALAPVYLGATLLGAGSGAPYWLTLLGQPYEVRRSGNGVLAPARADGELEVLPRRTVGAVVLQRARFWMHAARLQRRWLARQGAARLFDVAVDREALGMPRLVFARPARGADALAAGDDADAHKPLWVDTCNPFCLELLQAMVERHEWICLTEALPAARTTAVTVDGQAHAAELLVEALI